MSLREKIKQLFVRHLMNKPQNKEQTVDATNSTNITTALTRDPVSDMIDIFKKSEENWMTSSMSRAQEINCRLNFMHTHQKELQMLNRALAAANSQELRSRTVQTLESLGISELMKDYNAVFGGNSPQTDYIMRDQNSSALEFRNSLAAAAQEQGLTRWTLNPAVADFQKLLYSKQNYGLDNTVRPFIDNFMSLPHKMKLKVMYSLENNKLKEPVTDEELAKYTPNAEKAISSVMRSKKRFLRHLSSTDMRFDKLKECMDKEADAEAAQKKQAQEAEQAKAQEGEQAKAQEAEQAKAQQAQNPEADMPQMKTGVRDVNDIAVGITSGVGNVGLTISSVVAIPVAKHALKNATEATFLSVASKVGKTFKVIDGVGKGLVLLSMGKSCVDLAISTNNRIKLANAKKQLQELMTPEKFNGLKDEQKDAITKLSDSICVAHRLNVTKQKVAAVDAIVNAANVVTAFVSPAKMAAAIATPIAVGVGGSVLGAVAKAGIENDATRKIVDRELTKDSKTFEARKTSAVFHVGERFNRLPNSKKQQYLKKVTKVMTDEGTMMASLREQAVRESNVVDLNGLKNQIVYNVCDSTYMLLRGQEALKRAGNQTDVDKQIEDIANAIVKAADGRKIDFSGLKDLSQEVKPQERENIAKEMTAKSINMGRV